MLELHVPFTSIEKLNSICTKMEIKLYFCIYIWIKDLGMLNFWHLTDSVDWCLKKPKNMTAGLLTMPSAVFMVLTSVHVLWCRLPLLWVQIKHASRFWLAGCFSLLMLFEKLVYRGKLMRRRLADISYTVLECYLQENWAQDASWINIMLAFRRNLWQVPANKKLNGRGWLSFLYVQWICMKITENWPQVQAAVSYVYVS